MEIAKEENFIVRKTREALLGTCLLNESFIAFFGLMPFILRKDLLASTFQISLFTMLKPAVSVLSFYWGSRIAQSKSSLRYNLVVAGVLARVPFLLFPFFKNVWYLIFASAIYMLFSRASIPAWIEVLKLNLNKSTRERLFSLGTVLGYLEGVVIAFFLGAMLDGYPGSFKIVFFVSTILGLFGVFMQWKTPISFREAEVKPKKNIFGFVRPWKEGVELMRKRRDFAKYQVGTMIMIFGFMLAVPAIYLFYADGLKLTHSEMTMGRYVFMGMGFVLFSPIWARAMGKFSINKLTGYVGIGFGVFPIFIMLATFSKVWIFLAFLSYGITQAGSHLIWNLSGALFAKDEDSTKFTSINVLAVGVRGLIAPLLGGFLCEVFGPIVVFCIAILLCFLGSFYMFSRRVFLFREGV
jgi:MFS family permease